MVFRKKALSRNKKTLVIISSNIVIFALLILAVNNLDYLLIDQVSGESRNRSGRIIALLAMGLPIMLVLSIKVGVSTDKSIHITNEGLGFDQPDPFSKPIPWSQIKSITNVKSTSLSFEVLDSSEWVEFTVNLRDYDIDKKDVPRIVSAIEDKISKKY